MHRRGAEDAEKRRGGTTKTQRHKEEQILFEGVDRIYRISRREGKRQK